MRKARPLNAPVTHLEELVDRRMASGDPFSGRRSRTRTPLVTFQLEYRAEAPLYVGLDRHDLRRYAEALARCWALLGATRGDRIAVFDFGSSPLAYLASSLFTPYLARGAADLLGCVPICNDGVPTMAARAVQIVRFVRPRLLFIRSDVLYPFAVEAERQGIRLPDHVEALVVAENEGVLPGATRADWERRLGVPLHRLVRVDAALFFAVECPACRAFHSWPDLYHVEVLREASAPLDGPTGRGALVITNRFARVCPSIRFRSQLHGALGSGRCARAPRAQALLL